MTLGRPDGGLFVRPAALSGKAGAAGAIRIDGVLIMAEKSPPVDKAARLFVLCCAAGFVAIAASVVIVVVKFLL